MSANAQKKSAVKAPTKKKPSTTKKNSTVKETKGSVVKLESHEYSVVKTPEVKAGLPAPTPPENKVAPVVTEAKPQKVKEKKVKAPKVRQPSTQTRGLINNRKIGVEPGMTLVFRPNDKIKVTAKDDIRTFELNGENFWGIATVEEEAYKLAKIKGPSRFYGWAWDRLNADGTRTPVKQIYDALPVESKQDPAMALFKDKKDSPIWNKELVSA